MASLKSLKTRIKSVKSTEKITKAMQMIASSKLRKARQAAEKLRYYSNKLSQITAVCISDADKVEDYDVKLDKTNLIALTQKRNHVNNYLILMICSDMGLCGAINNNLGKEVRNRIAELEAQGKNVKVICFGKKALPALGSEYKNYIIRSEIGIDDRRFSFDRAENLVQEIIEMYTDKQIDICEIHYNHFVSTMVYKPTAVPMIPLRSIEELTSETRVEGNGEALHGVRNGVNRYKNLDKHPFRYEQSPLEILAQMLVKSMATVLYHSALENIASELASRTVAMDNANRNAKQAVSDLSLEYNKSRQAEITRQLIDIVSGSEAV